MLTIQVNCNRNTEINSDLIELSRKTRSENMTSQSTDDSLASRIVDLTWTTYQK
jgi:hypothetical protein